MTVRYWFSHAYKLNFLGIPKTGSTSIRKALQIHPENDWHKPPLRYDYPTFTVLRDPLSRVISGYKEAKRRGTLHTMADFTYCLDKIKSEGFFDEHLEPMHSYFIPCDNVLIYEKGLDKEVNKIAAVNLTIENSSGYDIEVTKKEAETVENIYYLDYKLYNNYL